MEATNRLLEMMFSHRVPSVPLDSVRSEACRLGAEDANSSGARTRFVRSFGRLQDCFEDSGQSLEGAASFVLQGSPSFPRVSLRFCVASAGFCARRMN